MAKSKLASENWLDDCVETERPVTLHLKTKTALRGVIRWWDSVGIGLEEQGNTQLVMLDKVVTVCPVVEGQQRRLADELTEFYRR